MARVTVADVKEIFDTELEYNQITAFIVAANSIVTNVVEVTGVLDAATLKEVERWVAAHLASIRDPIALRSKIGDAEAWHFPAAVTTAWGKGLNLTPYGQQAIALDWSGSLALIGNKRASFRASPRENSSRYSTSDD